MKKEQSKKSKAIYTIIVIVLLAFIFKQCFSSTPSEKKVYETSSEWLENDSSVEAALMTIVEKTIKEQEKVEMKMNWKENKYAPNDKGIYDTNGKFYKYDYKVQGNYTDKSTNKICDFTIDVAFENDEAMKEHSPYAVLFYDNAVSGKSFNHIDIQKLMNK